MSAVLPSREALEHDWPVFEAAKPPLSSQEKLAQTSSVSTLTHVRMPDGQTVRPEHMQRIYGFSYNQWRLMREELPTWQLRPEAVHVELGGIALTLDAFTAGHQHIELGQE